MSKVKVTIGATLPTDTQYENVQPVVEVEADTFEEARDIALGQIKSIADKVRAKSKFTILEQSKPEALGQSVEVLSDKFDKTPVKWIPSAHKYLGGYLSGSAFAHQFVKEFPSDRISSAMAKKAGVDQQDILDMWALNAEASTSLGTAIHAALELYGKYQDVSVAIKASLESVTHKNPYLKQVQQLFFADREDELAIYEPFIADKEEKLCGFIDRLKIIDWDKKIVRVQDYKTNPDISKKKEVLAPFTNVVENTELGCYWLQLSFYAYVLQKKGFIVEGLDIFNIVPVADAKGALTLTLTTYEHDVVDISKALNKGA